MASNRQSIWNCFQSDANRQGNDEKDPTFMDRLEHWSDETTFHGFKEFIHRDVSKARRVIWFIMVWCCMGYFVNILINRILYFASYPHSTKVDVTYVPKIAFPAITICNVNSVRLSPLTDNDLYHAGRAYGIFTKNWELEHAKHYPESFQKRVASIDWPNYKPDGPFDVAEFTKRTGHQIEDMLLTCKWREFTCGPQNFSHIITDYGNCYTFNEGPSVGELLHSTKPGRGNGLRLYLNIEEYDYLHTDRVTNAGLKILLHSQTEPPLMEELGYGLEPESNYFIAVRKNEITSLPAPYGDCVTDEMTDTKYFKHYSAAGCRIECQTQLIIDKCKCRHMDQPPLGDAKICDMDKIEFCVEPELERIMEGNGCICKSPCKYDNFDMVASSLRIRNETIEKMMESKPNIARPDVLSKNIVGLNVFFESLNFETVEQFVVYPSESLFGDIGGQFGLFVGASVLTIAHFLEYLFDEIGILLRRLRYGRDYNRNKIPMNRSLLVQVTDSNGYVTTEYVSSV
ncbi:acid-sensing ion channel 2-like isoform X2 [Tubulanus polymorphus]|uniref:acid-sensing ion channel 2-like isoform X2 n=1 Tax=Tubulanus polymorphus TaxID=672921 RepID=UPI003DA33879